MKTVFLFAAALFVCSAHLAHAGGTTLGDPENGKEIASRLCSQCHVIDTTGESSLPPAPPFRELVTRWPLEYLEESLAEGISVGHEAMPEFRLDTDEIADLLAFIGSIPK